MNQLVTTTGSTTLATDLSDKIAGYVRASKSANTLKAYRCAWAAFAAWCRKNGVDSLPATPGLVVAFLADQAGSLKVSTLELRLAAIRQAHDLAGFPSPTKSVEVATIMQGIRRRHGTKPNKKQALMVGDLIAICARLGDDLRGHRDRALLVLGFVGGFRRSELVNLNVEDIVFKAKGMQATITKGKTDQDGRGRVIGIGHGGNELTCPVTAIRRWLTASGITTGPVLRGVDRHGHLRQGRLSPRSVARIVQGLGEQVGLDPKVLGGHSLRSGFASSAAAAGIEERDIARVTGHRSLLVLRGYIQEGTLFDSDVVQRLGL
jgi:site-specific recombinase XerD